MGGGGEKDKSDVERGGSEKLSQTSDTQLTGGYTHNFNTLRLETRSKAKETSRTERRPGESKQRN